MGWKPRVREAADRNPHAIPSELLGDTSNGQARRWPAIQKHAIRNAMIGVALMGAVFWVMHGLAIWYGLHPGRLHIALGIASFVFAGLFCLLGESVIEDGVKSAIVVILGCLSGGVFPLPWCLIPGAGAVVGSIINGTIQGTLGRYF